MYGSTLITYSRHNEQISLAPFRHRLVAREPRGFPILSPGEKYKGKSAPEKPVDPFGSPRRGDIWALPILSLGMVSTSQ
jgi:hypothetical protein